MQEAWTKKTLLEFIRERTHAKIVDMGGWFCCIFGAGKQGPGIAFRAEMDGLPMEETLDLPYASGIPGVSHKCGHDGHAACLCGLALELERKTPYRPIYLIFQPGEETGSGGKECTGFLQKEGIGEVYAFHNLEGFPEGSVVVRDGLTQPASEGLTLRFFGKPSHASKPEQGANPSGAIAKTVLYMEELLNREHTGMILGTVVGMSAGTGDFGISAGEGELKITLRAENEEDMLRLEKDICSHALFRAEQDGLKMTYRISDYFPETRNGRAALEKVRQTAAELGMDVIDMPNLWRASEDFGYYTKVMEGAIFYIGTGEDVPALHTAQYDFNDRIVETAIEMFYILASQ